MLYNILDFIRRATDFMQSTALQQAAGSVPRALRKFWKPEWRYPLLMVLVMRVALTLWLAAFWLLIDPVFPPPEVWRANKFILIDPQPSLAGRMFIDVWLRWDAVHFINIAQKGYQALDVTTGAFFPGYPILVRAVAQVATMGNPSIAGLTIAGLFVSTVSTLAALILFYELVVHAFQDTRLARWTILLWAVFPTSFFLMAPYSEALFAAVALGALLAIHKKQWLLCGVLTAYAGLVRNQGILLLLPILLGVALDLWKDRSPLRPGHVLSLLMAPAGWAAYYLWYKANLSANVMDLYDAGWTKELADPITVFIHSLQYTLTGKQYLMYIIIPVVIGFSLMQVWMLIQKRFWSAPALLLYSVVIWGSLLVWDRVDASAYDSVLRYLLSVYPLFIGLAWLMLKIKSRTRRALVAASAFAMFITAALFSMWVFVG